MFEGLEAAPPPPVLEEADGEIPPALLEQPERFDAFGLDLGRYDRWIRFSGLYFRWLRVTVDGLENVPVEGPALLVGNHAGHRLHDAASLQYAVRRHHPGKRVIRSLMAWDLGKLLVAGHVATQYAGCVVGHPRNADYLLGKGSLVLVYPEGTRAAVKPFRRRHQLCGPEHWGSGFVKTALKNEVPIIPVVTQGFETAVPTLWRSKLLGRMWGLRSGLFPVSPQTLVTGPFLCFPGVAPFPVRCRVSIGRPLDPRDLAPSGRIRTEEDVRHVSLAIRDLIQNRLDELVAERPRPLVGRRRLQAAG